MFGENLGLLLITHGKTQTQLAKYLKVGSSAVSNWIKNKSQPRKLTTLLEISEFFGVPERILISDKCMTCWLNFKYLEHNDDWQCLGLDNCLYDQKEQEYYASLKEE